MKIEPLPNEANDIRQAIKAESDALKERLRGKVTETALAVVDSRTQAAQVFMESRHRLGHHSRRSSVSHAAGYQSGHVKSQVIPLWWGKQRT